MSPAVSYEQSGMITTYCLAVLVDKFLLTPAELAKLTDRQISALYFHQRDEHGVVTLPDEARPAKSEREQLEDAYRSIRRMRPENMQEALETIDARLREIDGG